MSVKQKANVKLQLLSLIFVITALIGFAHIKKLKHGGLLMVLVIALNWTSQVLLPYPFGFIIGLAISYSILVHYMLKWSKEWNESIGKQNTSTSI